MHRDALTHIDLYCTSCRTFAEQVTQYKLMLVPEETKGDYIISGWLECTHCRKRYRISRGVPQLVPSESLVTVGLSSGSEELAAQYLDAHYGTTNLGYWHQMSVPTGNSLCLDVGCSVGRYTFECAKQGFAVGVDLNVEHLAQAAEFQRVGKIRYTRKTRALRREEIESGFAPSSNALFLQADIHNPPFKMETFDFIGALNLLDSVRRPLIALGQMDAMLKQTGALFLSTPYVWNAKISEEWLETEQIDPHSFTMLLLSGKLMPECELDYGISVARTNIPWCLRKQDTQQFVYYVDAILAEKRSSCSPSSATAQGS